MSPEESPLPGRERVFDREQNALEDKMVAIESKVAQFINSSACKSASEAHLAASLETSTICRQGDASSACDQGTSDGSQLHCHGNCVAPDAQQERPRAVSPRTSSPRPIRELTKDPDVAEHLSRCVQILEDSATDCMRAQLDFMLKDVKNWDPDEQNLKSCSGVVGLCDFFRQSKTMLNDIEQFYCATIDAVNCAKDFLKEGDDAVPLSMEIRIDHLTSKLQGWRFLRVRAIVLQNQLHFQFNRLTNGILESTSRTVFLEDI